MDQKILVSRKEASAALGVSTRTLDHLIAEKQITARRVGKRVLIPFSELARFARHDHRTRSKDSAEEALAVTG
jgi:excisionase family DNA binding protein